MAPPLPSYGGQASVNRQSWPLKLSGGQFRSEPVCRGGVVYSISLAMPKASPYVNLRRVGYSISGWASFVIAIA